MCDMQNVKCLNVMGGGWGGMDGSVVQARPPRHSEWGEVRRENIWLEGNTSSIRLDSLAAPRAEASSLQNAR